MVPLGLAAAAFTARVSSTGNSWNTAGPATQLDFTSDPSNSTGGTAFATQPVVAVLDAAGDLVGVSNASVTLSVTTPAGATLSCAQNPKAAVLGVATFAGCKIDKAGTYTLTATSGTLTGAVSASFVVTAGSAAALAFSTNPSFSNAGTAFATQPVVAVRDAGGNTVTPSTAPVTLSLTSPAGATLTCTANPKAAVAGLTTFAGCRIDNPGTYTLSAASPGLTTAVSASFIISVGSTTKLAFTTSPSVSTGGIAFGTQPVVAVQDAGGHTVTTSTVPVTLVISTPAGATLTCAANPVNAIAGVATFAGCGIDRPGTYTLTAASLGLTNAVSSSFTITVGPATKLAFTAAPSNTTAAIVFGTQPVVVVQDAGGNTVTASTASVTLSITTPAGATLTCTTNPTSAVLGLATFAGCSIGKSGTYTLTAAASGLTNTVSSTFTIAAGPATQLGFATSPSGSTGGIAFGTQPVAAVQDAGGNTVTTSSATVSLTITTPAGATLACAGNPTTAFLGVATFSGCKIDKIGTYTLTAAASGLTSAVSASFTIALGPATKLGFTVTPASTAVNTSFAAQPKVAIQDAGGNTVTSSSASVLLAITAPAGGALITSCSVNPRSTTSGVATFASCRIDTAGTYTLTATASGLTAGVSASVPIFGTASKLGFRTSPSGSVGGTTFATQPVVVIQDANGNTVTTATNSVTLTLTTPGGATLACTANPKAGVAGVVTYGGCKVNKSGTYTLTAASSGLTGGVSASFTITAGPATKLGFSSSPSSSISSNAFSTQPVVTVQDANGNTVTTGTNPVTVSITTPAGAVLTCTANPTSAVAGVATFAGCMIDKTGTYTLTAGSSGLTSAASASFSITAGSASKLSFTTSPSSSASGTAFTTQPRVTVQDAYGNTLTTSTASVALSITTAAGATLTCTANPQTASSGVATFAGCKIDKTGVYTLTAASSGLASAVSASFTITPGAASKLAFATQPSSSTGGIAFPTQPVINIQDANGNLTAANSSITLALTSAGGAVLTCTSNPATAVSGVDVFAGCKVDKPGTYTLTATASALTSGVSTSFTITTGPAAKLAFTTQPSGSTGGIAFGTQPVVTVRDAGGNTVTTSGDAVSLTITTPAGAILTCTANPATPVLGLVTFAGCRIDKPGTYTLTATSGALTTTASAGFTIASGVATRLAFSSSPSSSTSGTAFTTQPVVAIQDAGGNTVTSSAASVTLTITPPTGGAVLTCTNNPKTAVSGVVTFAGCSISAAGTFTLTATSGTLTSAVSSIFTIASGSALAAARTASVPAQVAPSMPANVRPVPGAPAPARPVPGATASPSTPAPAPSASAASAP
jgi:hypothetical protein